MVGGCTRITPAGAGKTQSAKAWSCLCEDHPRRCGENLFRILAHFGKPGSPPQVRGKLEFADESEEGSRITPAGAGKTYSHGGRAYCREDHPRRCGENNAWGYIDYEKPGSPPQVRGKPFRKPSCRRSVRITPAGAGKTPIGGACGSSIWDHPRRCGENFSAYRSLFALAGSPPQVRGKRPDIIKGRYRQGITPAGAGKTL